MSIGKILKALRAHRASTTRNAASSPASLADLQDLTAAYRIILGREPDRAGFENHAKRIRQSQLTLEDLANVFINSDEYRARHADTGAAATEIYSGYLPEDRARIETLRALPVRPYADCYTDFAGQRFHPAYHPAIEARVGQVGTELPLPGDGHLSDGIEYAAAALAFERAKGRDAFRAAECGAGWGPWTTLFGLVARRRGFKHISLTAFEADRQRFANLRAHLAHNGLVDGDAGDAGQAGDLRWNLLNAAVWWQDETLLWPDGDNALDAGMRAETRKPSGDAADYRGFKIGHREIPALSLPKVHGDGEPLDIIHMDIQGGEALVIPKILDFMNRQVRSIFIGTHSRKIEGDLFELLYGEGWKLAREKPCRFEYDSKAPTLEGRTSHDGAQYWLNPAL